MLNGESSGVGNTVKQKAYDIEGADVRSGRMKSKARMQTRMLMEEIFGKESESGLGFMECSMCGDVGFQEHLLHCSVCHKRQEHSYCSLSYLESRSNEASWVCDWCWPSLKPDSIPSVSDRCEKMTIGEEEGQHNLNESSTGEFPRAQNGLDLLLEVACGTSDYQDLEEVHSPAATKGPQKESGRRTAAASTGSKIASSPPKPSATGKRRQSVGQERWSVTQKRACSKNFGIQLDRSSLSKGGGFGRRYRLLSSMLC